MGRMSLTRWLFILLIVCMGGILIPANFWRSLTCEEVSVRKEKEVSKTDKVIISYPSKPFGESLKSGRVIEYVENYPLGRVAYIWRAITEDGSFHDELLIHIVVGGKRGGGGYPNTFFSVQGRNRKEVESASDYALNKIDDKIIFLNWEFGKYGDPYDPKKISNKIKWEHSKAYLVNWDGQEKEEVDKNKYYYYDTKKDQIFIKPEYKDYRKYNISDYTLW